MPYQRSERFIGPQLWAQAFSEMGAGMAEAIQQQRQLKEESQGLDMMGEMLQKQFKDDPTASEKFGEQWAKWPGMSNTQKKSFLGGLGAFMGNQIKAREDQAKAQEAALRMAGMTQDLMRKAQEQAGLQQFAGALNQRMNEPNAVANFVGGMQRTLPGMPVEAIKQFGQQDPAPTMPVTGSEVANIGLQAGVVDPKVIQQFADLTRQRTPIGTRVELPGLPNHAAFVTGAEGGLNVYPLPADPMKFAGKSSKGRPIPGAPDFVEITLPDGTSKILRKPVPNPLAELLAGKTKPDSKGKGTSPLEDVAEELRGAVELIRGRRRKGELTRDQAKAALMALGFTFDDESDPEEQ